MIISCGGHDNDHDEIGGIIYFYLYLDIILWNK